MSHIWKPLLFCHRELEIFAIFIQVVLLFANMMVPFYQPIFFLNFVSNIVSNFVFIILQMGRIGEVPPPLFCKWN